MLPRLHSPVTGRFNTIYGGCQYLFYRKNTITTRLIPRSDYATSEFLAEYYKTITGACLFPYSARPNRRGQFVMFGRWGSNVRSATSRCFLKAAGCSRRGWGESDYVWGVVFVPLCISPSFLIRKLRRWLRRGQKRNPKPRRN